MGGPNNDQFKGNYTGFTPQQPSGPDIFSTYNKVLPSSWNQGSPVTDPSAILNAYTKNLPAITNAAQNTSLEQGRAALPDVQPNQFGWTWQQWLNR